MYWSNAFLTLISVSAYCFIYFITGSAYIVYDEPETLTLAKIANVPKA
jgi:hypothetical protein